MEYCAFDSAILYNDLSLDLRMYDVSTAFNSIKAYWILLFRPVKLSFIVLPLRLWEKVLWDPLERVNGTHLILALKIVVYSIRKNIWKWNFMSEGHNMLPSSKCMSNTMIVADCDFCGQKTVSTLTFYKLDISNHCLLRVKKLSIHRI